MTVSCVCTQKNLKQEIVHKDDLSSSVVQHDVGFFAYVKRHAVPVLVKVDKFNGSYERSRFLRQESSELSEKTVQVSDLYLIRSPSMYADGTPRAPLSDDDEEMEPAYSRALRNVNWNSEGIVPRNNAVGNLDRGSISSNDCVEATNSHILTNKSNSTNITEQRCERMKETGLILFAIHHVFEAQMQCSFNTLQTQEYSRRPWSDAIAGNKRSSPIPGSHDVQMTSRNNLEKNDDSCRRLLRPQPPPIPQGSKPKVSNGDRAPRASSVRSYQRKSRQDGLLEENPSPPRIRRQMCSTPLLRPESTSRSGPFVPRSESTATQCGTRAVGNGLQKSSCHSSSPRLTTKLSSPADMECRLGTRPSFIQNIPSVSQMPNGSQYGANPFIIAPYLPPGLMQVPPHFSPLQYPGIFCNNTLIPPFIDSQTGGQFFGAFNNRQDLLTTTITPVRILKTSHLNRKKCKTNAIIKRVDANEGVKYNKFGISFLFN
ncbi:hypothetical protein DICVIV_01080 [Dictyocaulus viviparus]|uniref:Uncharacterized protein n=1 Tax=Dictyocaulus viviparus TaxID=29172 RepID=A0A0D8YDQ7_DICVI|nr:hypothetical protein DICVIV_01080 [Dictyocaulus viviparus]